MSKYSALRDYLKGQSNEVTLTFAELDDLIPGGLPRSAHDYEVWWNNDDATHPQSKSWGDAGFRAQVSLAQRRVRFVRQ